MTQRELELRKQKLDEQLREGIELLQAAHRQQLRALELVWQMSAEDPVEGPGPALSPPKRSTQEVAADVEDALARVPEVFSRKDLCAALGYEPDRNALYRVLQKALGDGRVRLEQQVRGQSGTKYRRLEAPDFTPAA